MFVSKKKKIMLMGKFLLFIFLLGSWELWSGEKGENFRSQFNIIMYSQTNVESQITLTTLYGKKITNIIKSSYPICASAILKNKILFGSILKYRILHLHANHKIL